jgi:hypothetical protein
MLDRVFAGDSYPYTVEARVAELKRMIGRLTMKNHLLKKLVAARSAFASDRQPWRQPMLEAAAQYAAEHAHSSQQQLRQLTIV